MENLTIPKNYHSALNLHDTQIAIKTVKDFFRINCQSGSTSRVYPHRFL